ncbi:hypothetical protein ES703_69161 [subsurface metagenome]
MIGNYLIQQAQTVPDAPIRFTGQNSERPFFIVNLLLIKDSGQQCSDFGRGNTSEVKPLRPTENSLGNLLRIGGC